MKSGDGLRWGYTSIAKLSAFEVGIYQHSKTIGTSSPDFIYALLSDVAPIKQEEKMNIFKRLWRMIKPPEYIHIGFCGKWVLMEKTKENIELFNSMKDDAEKIAEFIKKVYVEKQK